MGEFMDDAAIIKEARSWIGTRWMHGVALKGYGVDCGQFIVALAKAFGWIPEDHRTQVYNRDYALHNSRSFMREEVARIAGEVPKEEVRVGDILLFTHGRCASHAGIYIGGGRFVHSHVRHGVCEAALAQWAGKLNSVWRVRA